MHVQNLMNNLWDIVIFLCLVPKESHCIYYIQRNLLYFNRFCYLTNMETHTKLNFFCVSFALSAINNVWKFKWYSWCCFSYESRAIKGHVLWLTAAYWTTRCGKGLMSFHPVGFRHIPSDVTASKLCEGLMSGNSVWRCFYKIYCGFISVRKWETFGYVVSVFLSRKIKFISENFKLFTQSITLSFSDQPLEGKCWRWRPGEWGVGKQNGRFWEKVSGVQGR